MEVDHGVLDSAQDGGKGEAVSQSSASPAWFPSQPERQSESINAVQFSAVKERLR